MSIPPLSNFEANLEPGRILMHFYTNRKRGGDYYWQLKAYRDILAPRSTRPCTHLSTEVAPTNMDPTGPLNMGITRVQHGGTSGSCAQRWRSREGREQPCRAGTASATGTINLWIHRLTFGNLQQDRNLVFGKSCPKYSCLRHPRS